jgi:hypothetical protein
MPVINEAKRMRQEDREFEANLVYDLGESIEPKDRGQN